MKACGGKFSLRTTLQVAVQMLDVLEFVHGQRVIHRDLKPDNMMTGRGDRRVFLVDFGLAKKFMNSRKEHITF